MVDAKLHGMILVVEDVDEIRSQMKAMLIAKGYRVLSASNAEDAIQIAEGDRPLLILTDMELPTFGLLVNRFRDHDGLSQVPIVIVDINHPDLDGHKVTVVTDFGQLEGLIRTVAASSP